MVRQCLTNLSVLVLAFVFASSSSSAAEGHGGGGGHAVAGWGGGHAGCRGGFYGGGYRGGYYGYRGYYGYPGWYGVGFGLGLGLGYGLGYGYGYPCYAYPYGYPVYVDPGYPVPANGCPPPGPGGVATAPGAPGSPGGGPIRLIDSDVLLSVRVPPDAVVRINGEQTNQNGPHREFLSSGLSPGRTYTFVVSARWTGPDGQPVERERRIPVQGGERRTVDFLMPSPAAELLPAVPGH